MPHPGNSVSSRFPLGLVEQTTPTQGGDRLPAPLGGDDNGGPANAVCGFSDESSTRGGSGHAATSSLRVTQADAVISSSQSRVS